MTRSLLLSYMVLSCLGAGNASETVGCPPGSEGTCKGSEALDREVLLQARARVNTDKLDNPNLGAKGTQDCPDGTEAIADADACREAAELHGFPPFFAFADASFPGGCFLAEGPDGTLGVFFNSASGSAHADMQPLCAAVPETNKVLTCGDETYEATVPFIINEKGTKGSKDPKRDCTCGDPITTEDDCEKAALHLGVVHEYPNNAGVRGRSWTLYVTRRRMQNKLPVGCSAWNTNDWTTYIHWSYDDEGFNQDDGNAGIICKNPNYVWPTTCEKYTCPNGRPNTALASGFWVNSGKKDLDAEYASVQTNKNSMFRGVDCAGPDTSDCDENVCCGSEKWEAHDPCPAGSGSMTGKVSRYMKPAANVCPDGLAPFKSEWESEVITLCCKQAFGTAYGGGPVDDKKLTWQQRLERCKGNGGANAYKRVCNPRINPCVQNGKAEQGSAFVGNAPGSNSPYIPCPAPGKDARDHYNIISRL